MFGSSVAWAGQEDIFNSAAVGSRWLDIPASARSAALAGAFTARAAELGGMDVNPSAISGIQGMQAFFTHTIWVQGSSFERLAGAVGLGALGTAGLSVDYFNFGSVEGIGVDSSGAPVTTATFTPLSLGLGAGWARQFGIFAAGGAVRGVWEALDGSTARLGLQGAVGGRIALAPQLNAGASVENISLDTSGDLKPTKARLGLDYKLPWGYGVSLDLDAQFQPYDQSGVTWAGSAEWAAARNLLLRGGYLVGTDTSPGGPTGGLGWLAGPFQFDYAAYGVGGLGLSHLITLRWMP
jgi:hypothetical protein